MRDATDAAITLHFHPGWSHAGGTVLDSIARDGVHRSQWTTGTSNGGLTAHVGGDRWRWESRLFGGRYDDGPPQDRPVYGSWNRRGDPHGGSPRFGSAHLRVHDHVVERATFCWPDSVHEPEATGGPERLAELCAMADAGLLDSGLRARVPDLPPSDPLNDYVEAQVHGEMRLDRDVAALVVDPSDASAHQELLASLPCAVEVHPGYRVRACDIAPDYRGPLPISLATVLGGDITPARLALAQRGEEHDPQTVKWLWHCLARFGRAWPLTD